MFKILSTYIYRKKYIKCNIWRVAVRPSYIWDARFLEVKLKPVKVNRHFYIAERIDIRPQTEQFYNKCKSTDPILVT